MTSHPTGSPFFEWNGTKTIWMCPVGMNKAWFAMKSHKINGTISPSNADWSAKDTWKCIKTHSFETTKFIWRINKRPIMFNEWIAADIVECHKSITEGIRIVALVECSSPAMGIQSNVLDICWTISFVMRPHSSTETFDNQTNMLNKRNGCDGGIDGGRRKRILIFCKNKK